MADAPVAPAVAAVVQSIKSEVESLEATNSKKKKTITSHNSFFKALTTWAFFF